MGHPTCVTSMGTFDSQTDFCYTCGGEGNDDADKGVLLFGCSSSHKIVRRSNETNTTTATNCTET